MVKTRAQTIRLDGSSGQLIQMAELSAAGRITRRPKYPFRLRARPWVIQPCMIAPVLPGETMNNLLLQSRCVTDPIKDKLGGWWHEYYFFYVKLRDLADRDDLVAMLVENASIAGLNAAAATPTYHYGGAPDYVKLCLQEVTEWYFRDDGDTWDETGSTITIDSEVMPLAKASDRQWWDSLKLEVEAPGLDSRGPGDFDQLPQHMIDAGFQNAYDQWTFMRENTLTEYTFEDYLKQHGVRAEKGAAEDEHKPELLRYVRDWTYPANTIDPTNGQATSVASWSVQERADKARFFREPGFVFGVTVTRPKIYFGNQIGNAVSMLTSPLSWLPAVMHNDPYTSLMELDHDEGPLAGLFNSADDYWVDARDLFIYGDQFINYDVTETADANIVGLPASSGQGNLRKEFVAEADMDGLFSAYSTDPSDNGLNHVRVDGVVSLNVKTHQRDTT